MKLKKILIILILISSFSFCSKKADLIKENDESLRKEIKVLIEQYEKNKDDLSIIKKIVMAYFNILEIQEIELKKNLELSNLWLKKEPESPEANSFYAGAIGRMAGVVDDLELKIKYGKESMNLIDQAVVKFPDSYVVLLSRGIGGVLTPKMLGRYKNSIKDFEKILELKKNIQIPQEIMPVLYYYYIKGLIMSEDMNKAHLIFKDFEANYSNNLLFKILKEEGLK